MKKVNPQGKGQVPVLQSLEVVRQLPARDRSTEEWLLDYLIGALVISAEFSFKPIPNKAYYLYWLDGDWTLSIISPDEWGNRLRTTPVARCKLREDYSWILTPYESVKNNPEVLAAIADFQTAFIEFIDSPSPVVENLPFCRAELSWYPRLMAFGLSKSLELSLQRSGTEHQTGQNLLEQISYEKNMLLSHCTTLSNAEQLLQ